MMRTAETADAAEIRRLMQMEPGFWKPDGRVNSVEIEIRSAEDLAVLCEENGTIAGYACAHDVGFRAYLSSLIVSPASRGKGIAGALLQEIEHRLRARKCSIVITDAWRDAESFYCAQGWSPPDAILMRKRL